jgi:hypothetical protein
VATPATASVLTLMLILSGFMIKESSIPVRRRHLLRASSKHGCPGSLRQEGGSPYSACEEGRGPTLQGGGVF